MKFCICPRIKSGLDESEQLLAQRNFYSLLRVEAASPEEALKKFREWDCYNWYTVDMLAPEEAHNLLLSLLRYHHVIDDSYVAYDMETISFN